MNIEGVIFTVYGAVLFAAMADPAPNGEAGQYRPR